MVNTGGAGLRALDRACRKLLSLENALDGIDPSGKTDPAIVREVFIRIGIPSNLEAQLESMLEAYLSFLKEEVRLSEKYHVLPGISGILAEMSARSDVILGLATGNIELGARTKLERGNVDAVLSGDIDDFIKAYLLARKAA